MRITLIGPYPPPFGGISIHIKRMKKYLESKNIDVVVYNESKGKNNSKEKIITIKNYKKFIFQIPFLKTDILHFHSINKKVRVLLGFYKLFNKKIILSLHGESMNDQINNSNFIVKYLLYRSLKKIDCIACSNNKIKSDLVKFGIRSDKIHIIPEYIKPQIMENDIKSMPKNVLDFINNAEFLISSNGCVRFYKNEDLYGIDMLINLVCKLKSMNIEVNLLFALVGLESQSKEEQKYYYNLKKRIKELKIERNILIFESKDKEFYPILLQSKLFIRPTNTDGNSISLMEALDLNVPSIASDVCDRPRGTMLFKTRDMNDLKEKTINMINNYKIYKEKINNIELQDNANELMNLYWKTINGNN